MSSTANVVVVTANAAAASKALEFGFLMVEFSIRLEITKSMNPLDRYYRHRIR
jgi:hypothetical protein